MCEHCIQCSLVFNEESKRLRVKTCTPGTGFINISDKLGLILSSTYGDGTLGEKPFHEENFSVDIREKEIFDIIGLKLAFASSLMI